MRKFFALSLVLVISFFGTIGLSNIPQGLTAVKNVVSQRTSDMTSCDNGIEIDEICFETSLPEQNYQLLEDSEETPVQLGVRITNNSSTPYRFEFPYFIPQLSNSNGTLIEMGFGRNHLRRVKESDIPFIYPGQNIEWFVNTEFVRYSNNDLQVRGYASYGGVWSFRSLQPGEYNIRLKYISRSSKHKVYPGLEFSEYDGFWVGEVFTLWKKLYLR